MRNLKLNFLEGDKGLEKLNPIEDILHKYGQEISDYAKGFFNYIVTTTSVDGNVTDASLYIIVPEIGYDYKILVLSYDSPESVSIDFLTLATKQHEPIEVNIKNGFDELDNKVVEVLSSSVANGAFTFLIDQVKSKRESKEEYL